MEKAGLTVVVVDSQAEAAIQHEEGYLARMIVQLEEIR